MLRCSDAIPAKGLLSMRKFLIAILALGAAGAMSPAQAQIRLGETGLTATATGTFASDYLFRGLSQTRSRMAYQAGAEMEHSTGLYIGGFLSNVRFLGTDARQEVDVYGGYRFTALETSFDVGVIGYLYPGYTAPAGGSIARLNFFEGYITGKRAFGPVTLSAGFHASPDFFGTSGQAFHLQGGVDYATGLWDVTAAARVGHQWIQRNAVFAAPDYAWWSIGVSRPFTIANVGTVTATLAYHQSSISTGRCFPTAAGGQDVCGARVLGSLSIAF